MQKTFEVQQQENPSLEDTSYVRDRFIEFNNQQSGIFPSKEVHLFARDSSDQIVAGLFGDISWGWLHVDILWVDEAHRLDGIGTALMNRAEAEAKAMGVHNAFLETTDFQALGFYEKRGYRVFSQLEDQPPGHVCYYMKKTRSDKGVE